MRSRVGGPSAVGWTGTAHTKLFRLVPLARLAEIVSRYRRERRVARPFVIILGEMRNIEATSQSFTSSRLAPVVASVEGLGKTRVKRPS